MPTNSVSVSTYITIPDDNNKMSDITMVSSNVNWPVGDNASITTAGGFSFDTDGQKSMAVFDVGGKYKYNKYLNTNIRNRFKFGDEVQSYELRVSPLTVTIPYRKSEFYFNPNFKEKYNFLTHEWAESFGAFIGVTFPLGGVFEGKNLSLEAEGYNMQDIGKGELSKTSWSVNGFLKF